MAHEIKRIAQEILSKAVQVENQQVIGLAGWNPTECLNLYKKMFKTELVTLVDSVSKKESFVLLGNIEDMPAVPVMDCDYCATIINSGKSFRRVYQKMCMLPDSVTKTLMFTFCIRGSKYQEVSEQLTLQELNNILYGGTLEIEEKELCTLNSAQLNTLLKVSSRAYITELLHSQSVFSVSKILTYSDTTPMITGFVQWT